MGQRSGSVEIPQIPIYQISFDLFDQKKKV